MKQCFSCFQEFDDELSECPHCGEPYSEEAEQPIYLKPGTRLSDGRYVLGKIVGTGGFGIVYKAWDNKLKTIIAIKEFFVSRLMTRAEGFGKVIVSKKSQGEFSYRKQRFLAEARTMAQFGSHKNITNVFEFFEENGTAYIVMELLEGMTLSNYLKQCGGKLDYEFAVEIALEIGNALKSMHEKKIIHRDVAPDNIFISSAREIRIKLMDFGAAKLEDSTDEYIDIILKPGYSPPEQYDKTGNIGPWTDIYALGATMYMMVTGEKPDESTNRKTLDTLIPPSQLYPEISENLNNTILKAMAIERHLRFRNMDEFLSAIRGERKVITLAAERKRRNIRRVLQVTSICIVLAAGVMSALGLFFKKLEDNTLPAAVIEIWFSVNAETDDVGFQAISYEDQEEILKNTKEYEAMQEVKDDFEETFPGVVLELKAWDDKDYAAVVAGAAGKGELPQLFESTGLSPEILSAAADLKEVVSNVMAGKRVGTVMFLDQYEEYYPDYRQMPLGIEVPMAVVISDGASSIPYDSDYFKSTVDFGMDTVISADSACRELNRLNYGDISVCPEDEFFNPSQNASPVLLTSTLRLQEIRDQLGVYPKKYVYYDADKINCLFTYEWSIGSGNEAQLKVAESLLEHLFSNNYQENLMISICKDGQIPVNGEAFDEMVQGDSGLMPIKDIAGRFVFRRQ